MKQIRNLFFLFTVTLFAVVSVILDVFNYNPFQSSLGVFINFYISFFLGLAGILTIIIYFIKYHFSGNQKIYTSLLPSLRQAGFVSLAFTLLLLLKSLKILDWWVGVPLVIAVVLLELFFQTSSPIKKHKKEQKTQNI